LENFLILLAYCHVENYFYSSLPFLFVVYSMFGFPLCNDPQILGVSRYGNSLWSQWWWKCCSLVKHGLVFAYWSIFTGTTAFVISMLYEQAFWTTVKLLNFVLIHGIVLCLNLSFSGYLWMTVISEFYI